MSSASSVVSVTSMTSPGPAGSGGGGGVGAAGGGGGGSGAGGLGGSSMGSPASGTRWRREAEKDKAEALKALREVLTKEREDMIARVREEEEGRRARAVERAFAQGREAAQSEALSADKQALIVEQTREELWRELERSKEDALGERDRLWRLKLEAAEKEARREVQAARATLERERATMAQRMRAELEEERRREWKAVLGASKELAAAAEAERVKADERVRGEEMLTRFKAQVEQERAAVERVREAEVRERVAKELHAAMLDWRRRAEEMKDVAVRKAVGELEEKGRRVREDAARWRERSHMAFWDVQGTRTRLDEKRDDARKARDEAARLRERVGELERDVERARREGREEGRFLAGKK